MTGPASTEIASTDARSAPREQAEPSASIVVALAQTYPRLGDVEANLAGHLSVIASAVRQDAALVVFPELSLTGYFLKDQVPDVALTLGSKPVAALREASRDIDVVAGLVLESDAHRFYNAALYLSGGEVVHIHRKVYLPTYGLFDEQRYTAAGDRFRAFDAPLGGRVDRPWRMGILICEDLWHPSSAALLARQGTDVLICPSASPGRGVLRGAALGTAQSYDAMTRTYAQLLTAYVVYCNRAGFEDGVSFWGGSRAVAPDGSVLGEAASAEESLILHRLERGALRRARIAYPLLRDERHDVNDAETDHIRRRRARD